MALNKTKISVALGQGINTKSDEKVLNNTQLLELENAVFQKTGQLTKRFGKDKLSQLDQNGNTINQGSALGAFRSELNLYDNSSILTYSESTQNWIKKGDITALVADSVNVYSSSNNLTYVSSSFVNGYSCFVTHESGIRYVIKDESTGAIVKTNLITATPQTSKVVRFGDNFCIIYRDLGSTNELRYAIVSAIDTTVTVNTGTIFTINTSHQLMDIDSNGQDINILSNNSSGDLVYTILRPTLAVDSPITIATNAEAPVSCGIHLDSLLRVWITHVRSSTTNLWATVYSNTKTVILATTSLVSVSYSPVRHSTIVIGDECTLHIDRDFANRSNNLIEKVTFDITGSSGALSTVKRSVSLGGKAFLYNNNIFQPAIHTSSLQTQLLVLNTSAGYKEVARLSYGNLAADNNTNFRCLTVVSAVSPTVFLLPSLVRTRLDLENGNVLSNPSVVENKLDFSNESRFQNIELGDLYISGACPQIYDGLNVVEQGFNLFPEGVLAVQATTGGSTVANGTYQIVVCYEWTDNLGQIHRSAPSIPVSVTTSGGNNSITVTIPTLRLTSKSNVRLVVYSTESNGTTFYRASSISAPTLNNPAVDTVTFTRTQADATLIQNDILYTTGGVLENIAAPSSSLVVNYKNRIFIAGLQDRLRIAYSKPRDIGFPVEFSDAFTLNVDSRGGNITALGVLDNYLIIFKRDSVFAVAGQGPDNLGGGNDLQDPQLITTDAGCDNPNSVVITPVGLMFRSTKGIYLLDRSLSVTYIGANVEKFNNLLITSSQLLSDSNQVRFTTDSNICLVYDYFFQQWSTFTNYSSEDSVIWNNRFTTVNSSGEVFTEGVGFRDNGQDVKMKMVTSWLSMGDIQGYKRIYKMLALGEYKSPHTLQIKVAQDFENSYTQSVNIDSDQVFDTTAYGDASPYGDESPYGGRGFLYQFEANLKRQKCQSVKFSIQDFPKDTGTGESFNITGMAVEVGVKQGLNKVAGNKSFGLTR